MSSTVLVAELNHILATFALVEGSVECGQEAILMTLNAAMTGNFAIDYRTGDNSRKVIILVTNEDSDIASMLANLFTANEIQQYGPNDGFCYVSTPVSLPPAAWPAWQLEIDTVVNTIVAQDVYLYTLVAGESSLATGDVILAQTCNTNWEYGPPDFQVQSVNGSYFNVDLTLTNLQRNGMENSIQGQLLALNRVSRVFPVEYALNPDFVNSFFGIVVRDVSKCNTSTDPFSHFFFSLFFFSFLFPSPLPLVYFLACPPNSFLVITVTGAVCECEPGHFYNSTSGNCEPFLCPEETVDNVTFPSTEAGQAALGKCPIDYVGNPTRVCFLNGSWDEVQSPCESKCLFPLIWPSSATL